MAANVVTGKCCGRNFFLDEMRGINIAPEPDPPIPCEEICLTTDIYGLLPNPPTGCEFALVTSSSSSAFEFIIAQWSEDLQDWEQLAYAQATTDPTIGLATLNYSTLGDWEIVVNGNAPLSGVSTEVYDPPLTTVNITLQLANCEYQMTEVLYPLATEALIFSFETSILSSPVADPTSLTDWNNYFSGFYSSPFTSIQTDDKQVYLFGGEDVIIPADMFLNNGQLVGMIDNQNCVVEIEDSAFQNCTALLYLKAEACAILGASSFEGAGAGFNAIMPVCTTMGVRCFYQALLINTNFESLTAVPNEAFYESSLQGGNWSSVLTVGDYSFFTATSLASLQGGLISMPVATDFGSNAFALSGIDDYYFPLLENIGDSALADTGITIINLPELLTCGQFGFSNNDSVTSVSLPKATFLDVEALRGLTSCTTVDLPLMTACGASMMRLNDALTLVNIPLCADLGGTPGDNFVFESITGQVITINCPASLQTIDAGNPDGDLVYLAANNTATINYIP